MGKRFIHIVDGFYPNPERIRQRALEIPYTEPENLTGWRTQAYQPKGIRRLIEKRFRISIRYWEDDLTAIEVCNGVFFSAFSNGRRAENNRQRDKEEGEDFRHVRILSALMGQVLSRAEQQGIS